MATNIAEKSKNRSKSPKRPRRSLSPNNVVINGQIIDKNSSESLHLSKNNPYLQKHLFLDNIIEESDPTIQDYKISQENLPMSLENTVKIADENVQKFIQEMSSNSQIQENKTDFKEVCEKSQEELKGLSNFLSNIDSESKNKILDTLISVYKKEILSSVNNVNHIAYDDHKSDHNKQEDTEPKDKIKKFKNVCKGLINDYKKKPATEIKSKTPRLSNVSPRNRQTKEMLGEKKPETQNILEENSNFSLYNNILHTDYKEKPINDNILEDLKDYTLNDFKNYKNEGYDINIFKDNSKKEMIMSNQQLGFQHKEDKAKNKPPQCSLETKNDFDSDNSPNKELHLNSDYLVNFHMKYDLFDKKPTYHLPKNNISLNDLIDDTLFEPLSLPPTFSKLDPGFNPFTTEIFRKKKDFKNKNLSKQKNTADGNTETIESLPIEIRPSKEEAINRILGRKQKENISRPKVTLLKKKNDSVSQPPAPKVKPGKTISQYYNEIKKSIEDPQFADHRQFKSEGVQAAYGIPNKFTKLRDNFREQYLNFLKPYKYHNEYPWESQSDIVMECPFGCHLKYKKSRSDTNINGLKKDKNELHEKRYFPKECKNNSAEKDSVIKVDQKASIELLKARDIRRKKQMINYLQDDLKRGDSDYEVSQILFQTSTKNIDHDTSSIIIPTLDEKHIGSFNANYLLHAVKIQKKSEILPAAHFSTQYFNSSISNPSITEEDYRTWLRKQNWSKYSKIVKEMQSFENLQSVSEIMHESQSKETPKETCGEMGYYLDRGDATPQQSTVRQTSSFLADCSDLFLYEHVVVSKFINFCCSFNAQRTKILNLTDRFLQIAFFGLFYIIWVYLDNNIFVEPKLQKGKMYWK